MSLEFEPAYIQSQEAAFVQLLPEAVQSCLAEGTQPIFSAVATAMMLSPRVCELLPDLPVINVRLLYQYISAHDDLGVKIYGREISRHLQVEPDYPTAPSPGLVEGLGYALLEKLPQTWARVCRSSKAEFHRLDQCEREFVGLLEIDQEPPLVVKATNSDKETEIARCLGSKQLAPQVFEATPNYIVEEFLRGQTVEQLLGRPRLVGEALGWILFQLHQQGIVYNNRLRDHVIVIGGWPRIIDLEGAFWGNDYGIDWQSAIDEVGKKIYRDQPTLQKETTDALEKWRQKEKTIINF